MVKHHYILHQQENYVEIVSMLLKKENIDTNIQNKVCNIFLCVDIGRYVVWHDQLLHIHRIEEHHYILHYNKIIQK